MPKSRIPKLKRRSQIQKYIKSYLSHHLYDRRVHPEVITIIYLDFILFMRSFATTSLDESEKRRNHLRSLNKTYTNPHILEDNINHADILKAALISLREFRG
ncbi:unnamed protein product [Cunninghamella blakesleeana]